MDCNNSIKTQRRYSQSQHNLLNPASGAHYEPYKNVPIEPGLMSPLLQKSGENHRGKKQVNHGQFHEHIFNLNYDEKQIRKVPFRKTYNRDKLVLLSTNPSILSEKSSLTIQLPKSLTGRTCDFRNDRGESMAIERVKNIYGNGQVYKLRKDLNDQADGKLADVISQLKSDKSLNRNQDLNRKKMSHADREILFQLNHEVTNVRSLESWKKEGFLKKVRLEKMCR